MGCDFDMLLERIQGYSSDSQGMLVMWFYMPVCSAVRGRKGKYFRDR